VEQWNKIAIIGIGLLGGSLGLAIRERGLAKSVYGYVRRQEVIEKCVASGIVDWAGCDLREVVNDADLIILCTPILQMKSLVEKMLPYIKQGAILTDVGSAKEKIVAELESMVQNSGAFFVGSHPMAGSEKTGFEYARADLFNNAICVVTPTQNLPRTITNKVKNFWKSIGGRVIELSPEIHDVLVSRASHLPHLLAAQLVLYVLDSNYPEQQASLCATGFRDTTRIASGSPEMWRDIALVNKDNLIKTLDEFIIRLEQLKRTLDEGDVGKITEFFNTAKLLRDKWIAQNSEK
jgi:prephenate dehydrogenase